MSSEEGEMAASLSPRRRRRRGCPRSPAVGPLDDDELLFEILLRLPPQPSSLPRASLVCPLWRSLVSDRSFFRRFRIHHRSNPPLLGFFDGKAFVPTLDAPNRITPGHFSLHLDDSGGFLPLGCRHGLVLMLSKKRKQVLVWDPVTGDQHRLALPPRFDAEDTLTNGAVLRAAGDIHFQFQVILVVASSDDELHTQVLACIYSSETGVWGNIISAPLPSTNFLSRIPAVLVGDSLYWNLIGKLPGILEFDLERQSLAVIQVPVDMFEQARDFTVMRAEGGGLGLLLVSELNLSAQLWKRKTNCDSVATWDLGRTIELDKLLSLNSEERGSLKFRGFAECNNVVFLWTCIGLFMVQLESLQFKKLCETNSLCCCHPFETVYAADVNAAPAPVDYFQGSKSVHSPTKPAAFSGSVIVPAATHSTIKLQIDVPRRPQATVESPQKILLESLPTGNKRYEMMLASEGRFGIFYRRDKTENAFKWAEIDVTVYRRSIYFTIEEVLRRCMVKAGYENDEEINLLLTSYVPQLVNGVCMLTYLKIRSVNFALSPEGDRYIVKPKVPVAIEVPLPFAIAISQLGAVEVKSMPQRTIAVPAIPVAEAAHFMIPQNQRFKATDYAQAVKFAKSLGIEFSTVDLGMKTGSAWWLLRGEISEEVFHLSLPLPESNFSEDNAIVHSMFCLNPDRSFGTTLFTLGELNAGTYGYILRNPHKGMNANSFFALCSGPLRTMWKIE